MFDKYFLKIVRASDAQIIPVPNKFITYKSYSTTPHQRLDSNSYRDANGVLHRTVLGHAPSKCEFEVPPMVEAELKELQDLLDSAIVDTAERRGKIIHYCFDTHQYEEMTCYIPDITFAPAIIKKNGQVLLDKTRIAFIEY